MPKRLVLAEPDPNGPRPLQPAVNVILGTHLVLHTVGQPAGTRPTPCKPIDTQDAFVQAGNGIRHKS